MANLHIDLAAVTVFDKLPSSSSHLSGSAGPANISCRKSSNQNGRKGKGKMKPVSLFAGGDDELTDIPIAEADYAGDKPWALRARCPDEVLP